MGRNGLARWTGQGFFYENMTHETVDSLNTFPARHMPRINTGFFLTTININVQNILYKYII